MVSFKYMVAHLALAQPVASFVSTSTREHSSTTALGMSTNDVSRKAFLGGLIGSIASLSILPQEAAADVSDGNVLPNGVQQFARSVRLKSEIMKVKKRVLEGATEMDKQEWDNVGKFLRQVYSVGDDMKVVAKGIQNADNKARAMEDIEQLRKYAQAGDIPVSKQDGTGFVVVADKMISVVEDFFNALVDVPDEI